MPWMPELFSAPVLERLKEKWRQDELVAVPYFDGLFAGEPDALVKSFAGQPQLHDPIRGRVKGARAFEEFVAETSSWLTERNVSVEDIEFVVTDGLAFGEVGVPARAWRRRRRRDRGGIRSGWLCPRACG